MHQYRSPDSDHFAASKPSKATSSNGDDVMDVLAQVEQQLNRLKTVRKEQDQTFTARQIEMEKRAAEVAQQQAEIEAERQRVNEINKEAQRLKREFNEKQSKFESEKEELAGRLEQAEKNVGELIQQLESNSSELSEKNKEIKRSSAEVARLHKRINQLEESATEAQSRASERDDSTAKLKKVEAELLQRNKELSENQRKLDQASKKLAEFAKVLSDQTAQLERGAAAIAMVEQQQEQIDRLTQDLAAQSLSSDPDEIRRRDQRIADLTNALRQARGQSGGNQDVAELEQQNAELMAEVDRLKFELQNAQVAAEHAQSLLEQQAEGQSSHVAHEASSVEHSARIAALTAEIERLQSKASIDLREQLEAQEGKYQQELTAVQRTEAKALQELRAKISNLEEELRETREAASGGDGHDPIAYSNALREKAERISTVADHLRRRRARLRRARELMREKAVLRAGGTPSERMQTEELIRIENEKIQLAEVRKMLAKSERVMVKRWARSKAVVSMGAIALLLVVCAVIAWFTADYLFPAKISASVVIEARNHEKGEVKAEQLQGWAQWHLELLADPEFHKNVAKRMAERRLDQYNNPTRVAQRIRTDLTTDADDQGVIRLTLAGTDRNDLMAFLDVLTSTMLAESNRTLTKRSDNTPAVIPGERREAGRIRYASVNNVPISDERLRYALPIFGGLFIISLVVIVIAYTHLMRVKRVFDDEHAPLFNDSSTPTLH